MKNSDEAIKRVLTGLGEAEAPEGMTQRIQQAMQNGASATRSQSPMSLAIHPAFIASRTLRIAAAALIVVASVVCWSTFRGHRMKHHSAEAVKQPASKSMPIPNAPEVAAQTTQPLPVRRPAAADTKPASPLRKSKPDEMQATSYPAPEVPLTDEERLLLRLAHGADPQTLEAYSPSQSAAHLAQQKADFQQFFDPPTTVNNE